MVLDIYYTPLGEQITEEKLQEAERVICPRCGLAVLEDEYYPNPDNEIYSYCLDCHLAEEGW